MRDNTGQKIKLGLFVSIGTILLLLAVILIGRKQNMFNKNLIINTTFSDVNGLRLGNNIYYSGIKIGTVKNIEIIENATILVQMNISTETAQYITKKDIATISLSGLVGDMVVNIIPAKQKAESVKPGDTIASYAKTSTDNMLSTLNTTNEKVGVITDNLLQITTQIINGKGTLGLLLNDENTADDLKTTIKQLNQASFLASSTLADLKKNINSQAYESSVVGVLLSDSVSGNKIKKMVLNLEKSSENIHLVSNNLNQLVLDIQSNEGAIHYLSKNPELVNDIEASMQSIKEGTESFNQNMEALKTNFLVKKYFKNLEKN